MNYLYIINDVFTNGYKAEILDFISLVSVLSGILVIITKNPIVSVLFLILLFLSIASYLIFIGLCFIGISYLLVYVGAVSILFIFILMLINVRISELLSNTSNSIPLAIIIAVSFNYPVYQILPKNLSVFDLYTFDISTIFYHLLYNNTNSYINNIFMVDKSSTISFVSINIWDSNLAENAHITSIGNIMYTSYSIWLILTSIILLLAMVGAIIITIKQNN